MKNAIRDATTICGRDKTGMQKAAWFEIGYHKGGVYYWASGEKVCEICADGLEY